MINHTDDLDPLSIQTSDRQCCCPPRIAWVSTISTSGVAYRPASVPHLRRHVPAVSCRSRCTALDG